MMAWDSRIAEGMRRQSRLRQERLQAGAKVVGWKVGFGAPAAMQKLRIAAPLVGFILDRGMLAPGAAVSLAGWQKPVAEPEIAVRIGRDVPPDADDATARAAIAALGPAIEVADADGPMDDVEAVLACDIFQRHVIIGPADPSRAGARLDGLRGHVNRSGQRTDAPTDLEANTGALVSIVRHVAATTAHFADGLRAGQFIITGSVVPPLFVTAGETVAFELAPVGMASVEFTA